MYFCIKLRKNNKYLVIKQQWIENYDEQFIKNYGLKNLQYKAWRFFYSPNEEDNPDFELETKEVFSNGAHCYEGVIKTAYGKELF